MNNVSCVYTWLSTEVKRRRGTKMYLETVRLYVAYAVLSTEVTRRPGMTM